MLKGPVAGTCSRDMLQGLTEGTFCKDISSLSDKSILAKVLSYLSSCQACWVILYFASSLVKEHHICSLLVIYGTDVTLISLELTTGHFFLFFFFSFFRLDWSFAVMVKLILLLVFALQGFCNSKTPSAPAGE